MVDGLFMNSNDVFGVHAFISLSLVLFHYVLMYTDGLLANDQQHI